MLAIEIRLRTDPQRLAIAFGFASYSNQLESTEQTIEPPNLPDHRLMYFPNKRPHVSASRGNRER